MKALGVWIHWCCSGKVTGDLAHGLECGGSWRLRFLDLRVERLKSPISWSEGRVVGSEILGHRNLSVYSLLSQSSLSRWAVRYV